MAFGAWANTAWKQVWTNKYYALDIEWTYRQDPVANQTEFAATRWRCRSLVAGYSLSAPTCVVGMGTISSQHPTWTMSVTVPSLGNSVLDLTNQSRVFTHDSDGTHGTPYIHGYIDSNIGNDWNYNPYKIGWKSASVYIPNIDRTGGSGTASNSNVTTNSVTITYKPNVACDNIQYKIGNGSWVGTGKSITTSGGGTTTFNISGLAENTNYTIYVRHRRIYNQVYSGSASTSFKTKMSTDAGTATIAQGNVTTSTATVIYTPQYPSNLIEYSIDGGAWTNSGLTTTSNNQAVSINITGLSAQTTYTVSVRHRRTYNNVVSSAKTISVTTSKSPIKVLMIIPYPSDTFVTLKWAINMVELDGQEVGATFNIQVQNYETEELIFKTVIGADTWDESTDVYRTTVSGLTPNTEYAVLITPIDKDGITGTSRLTHFTTNELKGSDVWIKEDGTWVHGTLYVKKRGIWKKVVQAFRKYETWK